MKKKGFTLIELLAVIVILAIIALIATPLVLKYIEKSRKESKIDSAYSFVRNLETEIANYSIKNNGKKYTTNKESIKELGLDITVKGENPTDGKVCISSVGQVEKGVFQYGKYYVSYDGKKGSISDKDTYDNFSCSGNMTGGGSGNGDASTSGELVLTSTVTMVFNNDAAISGQVVLAEGQKIEIKKGHNYCMNLIKQSTGEKVINNYCMSAFMDSLAMGYTTFYDSQYFLGYENDALVVGFWHYIEETDYQIEIFEDNTNFIPYSFRIDSNDKWTVNSMNFVEGEANVNIVDAQGKTYYDEKVVFVDNQFGFIGSDSYETYLSEGLYAAIANGDDITVKVTQMVNGNEVVTTISSENLTTVTTINGDLSYYVFGNINMKHDY